MRAPGNPAPIRGCGTLLTAISLFLLSCSSARASVVFDVPAFPNYPGLQGGYTISQTSSVAQRWFLPVPYTDVGISAEFNNFASRPLTLLWFVTTHVGPGTTAADGEISSGTFHLPAASSSVLTLSSGLELPAGTYYLSVGNTDCTGADGGCIVWPSYSPLSGPITVSPGVAIASSALASNRDPYVPASTYFFFEDQNPFAMQVTGDEVPEPGAGVLLVLGLSLIICKTRFRR
jgi:hypothetical protein